MTSRTFTARVLRPDDGPGHAIELPFDPVEAFGRARAPVRVVINGHHAFRTTLASYGGRGWIGLRKAQLADMGLGVGDACFFVAGRPEKFYRFAGDARTLVGKELSLTNENEFALAWIVDFPFYEWDDEEKRVDFAHNPFSMPQGGIASLNSKDPLTIKAFQYDMVCNGYELASGSIRIHRRELQAQIFKALGYGTEEMEQRFGHMLDAFDYGAPPHGGMAPGIDRLVMLMADEPNIREVLSFPKTASGSDLMFDAPSELDEKQLRELHLKLNL